MFSHKNAKVPGSLVIAICFIVLQSSSLIRIGTFAEHAGKDHEKIKGVVLDHLKLKPAEARAYSRRYECIHVSHIPNGGSFISNY